MAHRSLSSLLNDGLTLDEQLFVDEFLKNFDGNWRKVKGKYVYTEAMSLAEYKETCNSFDDKAKLERSERLWRIYADGEEPAIQTGYEDGKAIVVARNPFLLKKWLENRPPKELSAFDVVIDEILYSCSPLSLKDLEACTPRDLLYTSLRKLARMRRVHATKRRSKIILIHRGVISPSLIEKKDVKRLASLADFGKEMLDTERAAVSLRELREENYASA